MKYLIPIFLSLVSFSLFGQSLTLPKDVVAELRGGGKPDPDNAPLARLHQDGTLTVQNAPKGKAVLVATLSPAVNKRVHARINEAEGTELVIDDPAEQKCPGAEPTVFLVRKSDGKILKVAEIKECQKFYLKNSATAAIIVDMLTQFGSLTNL